MNIHPFFLMISVCGVYCNKDCHAFGRECIGCNQLDGKVSWAKFIGKEQCPIYSCVKSKGYITCIKCNKLPCDIWLKETKNPDMTDTEYQNDLNNRIKNLKQL